MATILVTGGCGYIGSHTIVDLIAHGFDPISADNNSRSDKRVLKGIEKITGRKVRNYQTDLCDLKSTEKIFEENPDIKGVIHFAAFKTVPESVARPLLYFKNNLESLLNVLSAIKKYHVPYFIFSSSCSVYGNVQKLPVTEETPLSEAECPYARTKQMGEQIIKDFSTAHANVQSVLLRYFNPVGAHPSATIGETPFGPPENLVPIITQTAIGKREKLMVFGSDYQTRDGTCIRDYIHVMDIANAHTKALQYLQEKNNERNYEIYNLGTGQGVSVLEAIQAFEKVSGKKLNYELGPRRAGDVMSIYADNTKAEKHLGWKPRYDVDDMMRTAWDWEQQMAEK